MWHILCLYDSIYSYFFILRTYSTYAKNGAVKRSYVVLEILEVTVNSDFSEGQLNINGLSLDLHVHVQVTKTLVTKRPRFDIV